ncbi:tetratricopeptide repeat protein [Burkholderia ubonensis]|uniref:tetratricopeptide repeat protein n=1 Tax=Burkholderia ubonensis TaxID=101571 RepID=UPI0007C7B691|nr:tetratricopeptide repeat protein [Burkholderia ubonensis]
MTVDLQLEAVDVALNQGNLIGAAMILEARGAAESTDPHELVLLARVLLLRGRRQQAIAMLERALEQDGQHIAALVVRAHDAIAQGDLPAASEWFSRAWQAGRHGESWVIQWLDVLMQLGLHPRASEVAQAHCACVPQSDAAWFWLGYVQHVTRQFPAALQSYEHCARLNPKRPMLANNLAALCLERGDIARGRELLELTLGDDPHNALAWTNYAVALLKQHELTAAQIAVERALAIHPDYPVALRVHSNVLKELQEWDRARAAIDRAQALMPEAATTWSQAMLQLAHGEYEAGWVSHEARWLGSPEMSDRHYTMPMPRWEGQSLAGKTLVVWGEQGHGDVLQFVRFVPVLAERVKREGGTLVYCTFHTLQSLLERSLAGVVVPIVVTKESELPSADWHVPLASLPLMLGVRVEDLPMSQRYLKADTARVDAWRNRLRDSRGLRVGLVWSGNRTHQRNSLRSVSPVAYAKALGAIKGVEFFNLQVSAAEEVQSAGDAGLRIRDHTAEFASYDDTAAYIQNLDLIITVCTSIAHLAGGLGVPTWLLLDVNPHWVWMTERSDSPWYPSVKLYRQSAYQQWDTVLTRVATDVRKLVKLRQSKGRAAASVTHERSQMALSEGK